MTESITAEPTTNSALFANFWSRVDIQSPEACWEWIGSRTTRGYGQFYIPELGTKSAHRIAYTLVCGDIPEGLLVCHSCDNPPCCNPTHLWTGTWKDNSQDMLNKNRHRATYNGGRRPKLADEAITELRARYFSDPEVSVNDLLEEYSISRATLYRYLNLQG